MRKMGWDDELEQAALKFLSENCNMWKDKARKKKMEYAYQSPRQIAIRRRTEISESSLGKKQRMKCPKLCPTFDMVE